MWVTSPRVNASLAWAESRNPPVERRRVGTRVPGVAKTGTHKRRLNDQTQRNRRRQRETICGRVPGLATTGTHKRQFEE